MGEKDFVVFYAWQSDSPAHINRNFIESAVEAAIREVKKSGHVDKSPRLDKDTKNVSGSPDIANTILEKIQSADMFLGDLTYVATVFSRFEETTEDLVPNPNVMIELGYALEELGWERIVTVINTHYGPPEKLPFDLKNRRWPIDYNLPPDAETDVHKQQKEKLVKRISSAIDLIAGLPPRGKSQKLDHRIQTIETTISLMNSSLAEQSRLLSEALQRTKEVEPEPKQKCDEALAALIERIRSGRFEGMPPTAAQVVLAITLEAPLHFDLGEKQDQLRKLQPLFAQGWNHQVYGDRFITFYKYKGSIDAVTEITSTGIIQAASHEIISSAMEHFKIVAPEETKDTDIIPIMSIERSVIETVTQYCQLLTNLGHTGPIFVKLGLINLRKSILFVGARYSSLHSRVYEDDKIIPPPVEIPEGVDFQNPQMVAKALRPAFDFIWREYNYPRSLDYGSTGDWGGLPGM
jgi:hypothetical protein